jgi:hypothetical protein
VGIQVTAAGGHVKDFTLNSGSAVVSTVNYHQHRQTSPGATAHRQLYNTNCEPTTKQFLVGAQTTFTLLDEYTAYACSCSWARHLICTTYDIQPNLLPDGTVRQTKS